MSKFEYMVTTISQYDEESVLSELGANGWELVSVIGAPFHNNYRFYLKRPAVAPQVTTVPKGSFDGNKPPIRKVVNE